MTQLFIGHKPGVGPVVKILKHDGDDALTLANDAYDRYFFNSENQNLTQITSSFVFSAWSASDYPANGIYHFGGDAETAKVTVRYVKEPNDTVDYLFLLFRLENLYPNAPFLPVCEYRMGTYPDYRSIVARRTYGQWSGGGNVNRGYTFYNSFTVLAKIQSYTSSPDPFGHANWNKQAPNTLSAFISVGDYTLYGGCIESNFMGSARGFYGAGTRSSASRDSSWNSQAIIQVWNLPADSSPLPTYVTAPNLEIVRISPEKVAVARPGYDVNSAVGPSQFILDSDSDTTQAFCVAAGRVDIPANSSTFVANPTDIPWSNATVSDMLVKRVGQLQYTPAYHPNFTSQASNFQVSYSASAGGVTIYNDSAFAVTVTYMIFNADTEQGRSSGGERVMYRGNDGVRDFIQIKRPGSSDVDVRPSDILLDTRFPTVHILQEGWLPIGDFSLSPTGESLTLGRVRRVVPISVPAGLVPFVKFTTVFPDYILQPYYSIGYADTPQGNWPQGGSRQSSLCVLDEANSVASFYLNPNAWTVITNNGFTGNSPNPLGIRYYLFGLPVAD